MHAPVLADWAAYRGTAESLLVEETRAELQQWAEEAGLRGPPQQGAASQGGLREVALPCSPCIALRCDRMVEDLGATGSTGGGTRHSAAGASVGARSAPHSIPVASSGPVLIEMCTLELQVPIGSGQAPSRSRAGAPSGGSGRGRGRSGAGGAGGSRW